MQAVCRMQPNALQQGMEACETQAYASRSRAVRLLHGAFASQADPSRLHCYLRKRAQHALSGGGRLYLVAGCNLFTPARKNLPCRERGQSPQPVFTGYVVPDRCCICENYADVLFLQQVSSAPQLPVKRVSPFGHRHRQTSKLCGPGPSAGYGLLCLTVAIQTLKVCIRRHTGMSEGSQDGRPQACGCTCEGQCRYYRCCPKERVGFVHVELREQKFRRNRAKRANAELLRTFDSGRGPPLLVRKHTVNSDKPKILRNCGS